MYEMERPRWPCVALACRWLGVPARCAAVPPTLQTRAADRFPGPATFRSHPRGGLPLKW